ncbi:MAG: EamA family transporter [Caldilinea sp.]|jgi:drug/metabolite transporter (DMT)-like permease
MSESSVVLLGVLAALSWGGGDFCGGLAARRTDVYSVVLVAEVAGALLLGGLALLYQEAWPALPSLWWASAGGLVGAVGLLALYRALATGHMGIVAPLTAVIAGATPVVFGVATEGWPELWQLGGFVTALLAVWLLAGTGGQSLHRVEVVYTLVAGLSFGTYFILIDRATSDGTLFWKLAAARLLGALLLLAALGVMRRPFRTTRAVLPLNLLGGLLDAGGNLFFALAAVAGRLDVAAILSSLYPGTTVLLAWALLGQRLNRPQLLGVAAALAAILLIAA